MRKALGLFLALAVLMSAFTMLTACSDNEKDAVMKMEDGGNVSLKYMYLLASMQKSMHYGYAEAFGDGWNSEIGSGLTLNDYIYAQTVKSAKSSLVCEYLHDKVYKLEMTLEQKKSIDTQISSLEKTAKQQGQTLKEQLSVYSADEKTLRKYFEHSIKQSNLINVFYSQNGLREISDAAVKEYFEENYHIVDHIYFNLGTKYKADGTEISLTDEEISQKQSLAEQVYTMALSGEASFEELRDEYSEDAYGASYYPDGFLVTNDSTFPEKFTVTAIEMMPGDIRMIESAGANGNGIHIMYKKAMDKELYDSDETVYSSILSLLITTDFESVISEYEEKISVNEDLLSQFDVKIVPAYGV